MRRYLRYAILGFRLLWPTRAERGYARVIRQSGLFDRAWYLDSNPRLPRLCRWLPERHYVLVGEAAGLCPSPEFSPRAYLHLNPDLAARGVRPFGHYIAEGRARGRPARDRPAGVAAPALPRIAPPPPGHVAAPVAVVVHLYYREMWDEIAALLRPQGFDFDLFVTLTRQPGEDGPEDGPGDGPGDGIAARIRRDFPRARIWRFPNHGRDILPFLHLARSGWLAPYRAVCKLHTKASPHRDDGADWRRALFDGVLGDPARTAARLAAFRADPAAGLWVADGHLMRGADWWGANRDRGARILAQALPPGRAPPEAALAFAAGSIYWLGPAALAALAAVPLEAADFELEMGQVDGTTAHALERVFGQLVTAAGLSIRQASELDGCEAPLARNGGV
jgi:hypothetical protein